jgi:5-hydroxyisourate hydrolase-like protein (transthyretin family)
MKRLLLLTFGLALILISCKKYGNGYVMGTVIDASSGNPAEGVPVSVIVETREAKGQSKSKTSIIETVTTGADGKYKINFKKNRGWEYSYRVKISTTDKYLSESTSQNIVLKKSTFDFEVFQKAFAKLKITKTTTKPTRITIKIDNTFLVSTNILQSTTFIDSIVPFIFNVRGNFNISACVSAKYENDGTISNYCSPEQIIQIGDTAVFTVVYD